MDVIALCGNVFPFLSFSYLFDHFRNEGAPNFDSFGIAKLSKSVMTKDLNRSIFVESPEMIYPVTKAKHCEQKVLENIPIGKSIEEILHLFHIVSATFKLLTEKLDNSEFK